MGDSLPLLERGLGGPNIQAAIKGHRVHRDDLGTKPLGQLNSQLRFARAGRPGKNQGFGEGSREHAVSRERQNTTLLNILAAPLSTLATLTFNSRTFLVCLLLTRMSGRLWTESNCTNP